jgi:hypothetical protein
MTAPEARARGVLLAGALAAGVLVAGCGGEQATKPDYLTTEPHKLSEQGRALALFSRRYDEERVLAGAVECQAHQSGHSRDEAREIADQRARKELGDPLIKYRATGIVRLIHTWYCVLLVPGDDA